VAGTAFVHRRESLTGRTAGEADRAGADGEVLLAPFSIATCRAVGHLRTIRTSYAPRRSTEPILVAASSTYW